MEIKRTIKKIAALTGGALFAGASLAGAFAALDNLPQPFVSQAGVFNAHVVVGTMGWNPNIAFNAAAATGLAQDVAVGMDVAVAFGQVSVTGATGGEMTIEDGVPIKVPGKEFYYGTDIQGIKTSFTESDFNLLADGKYQESKGATRNNVDFTQKLEFAVGAGELVFERDRSLSNEAVDTYLKFPKNIAMTYTMDFINDVEFDATNPTTTKDDFKGTQIEFMGREYTISDATPRAADGIQKLELMSGARTAQVAYQETQSFVIEGTTYEITVNAIAQAGPNVNDYQASVTINGQTFADAMAGDTYTVDGLEIGVDTVYLDVVVPTNSKAHFFLGANKLLLEHGTDVKVNDERIDGWNVRTTFAGDASTADGTLESITITMSPKTDTYLAAGDMLTDPLFGLFNVGFNNLVSKMETIEATSGGTDGEVVFKNLAGSMVTIPFISDGPSGTVWPGNELVEAGVDVRQYGAATTANMFIADGDWCRHTSGTPDITYCEGIHMIVVGAGGEARIFEVTNIDLGDDDLIGGAGVFRDRITLRDHTTGADRTIDAGVLTNIGFANVQLTLTEAAGVSQTITATQINEYDSTIGWAGDPVFKTSGAGIMAVWNSWVDLYQDEAAKYWYSGMVFTDVGIASEDVEVTLSYGPVTGTRETKGSDWNVAMDVNPPSTRADIWGAITRWNTKDSNELTIHYPEEQVYANVFLAPTGAEAVVSTSGAVNVNYITQGISRTDVDYAAANPTRPVILIGGPSVNQLVNGLAEAGKTWTAAEYPENTAIIQLIEDAYGTNDALIVAGYAAADTQVAGRVLAARMLPPHQFKADLTGNLAEINTAQGFSGVVFK